MRAPPNGPSSNPRPRQRQQWCPRWSLCPRPRPPRPPQLPARARKASAPANSAKPAPAAGANLPKGFFDDLAADARAHGEKPRTKEDAAAELEQLQREVDTLERGEAEAVAAEAAEAGERQLALERFELQCVLVSMLAVLLAGQSQAVRVFARQSACL